MREKFARRQIKEKLMIFVITATLIVAVISGGLGMLLTNYSTNSAVKKNLSELPKLAAMAAQNSISTYTYTIGEIASNEVLSSEASTPEEKDAFVKGRAAAYYMRTAGYADATGYDVVNKVDISAEPFFKAALAGTAYMSAPYINSSKDDAYMVVSAPVKRDEQVVGVAYFYCDTYLLQTIVADLQVGEMGYAYILDKEGTVIASPDQSAVFQKKNVIKQAEISGGRGLKAQAKVEKKMISGESGIGSYSGSDGKILQGYAMIAATDGWSVAIAINQNEFMRTANIGNVIQLIFILGCIVATYFVAKKLAQSLASPIVSCAKRLEQLAEGDLTSPVPVVDSEDEIKTLADSTSNLIWNFSLIVQEFTSVLSSIAEGDLTQKEIEGYFPGDFAALREHLHTINRRLNETISGIAEAAEQVSAGASHVATTSVALSDGVAEQTKTVEQLVETVADINQIAHHTAELAEQARTSAEGAGNQLAASNEYITNLNDAMENISVSSGEIRKVIETIESIAARTNMLALNASIEAARAGDAGKGFAVVASEVGVLAAKSAEAVNATKELIERSMDAVGNGNAVVTKVTSSLSEVIELASDSVSKMQVVAQAVESQTEEMQKIITNTDRISDVVQATAHTAEESEQTSHELYGQADTLKNLIGGFSLRKE